MLMQIVRRARGRAREGRSSTAISSRDNIFLLERGDKARVKLLDFGIAKLRRLPTSSVADDALGAWRWARRATCRPSRRAARTSTIAPTSTRSAASPTRCCSGGVPFVADTAIDIVAMHLTAAPPSPRTLWATVPSGVEKIMLQMLSKEPDGRPSLMQVRAVFDAASRSITPTMGIAAGPKPQPPRRWTGWLVGGGIAALVVASGLYGFVTTRAHETTMPIPIVPVVPPPTTIATPAPAPAPAKQSVLLVHAPVGSHVGVDGQEYVSTGEPLRIDVAGGEHRVVVAAPHKVVWSEKVRVGVGATAEVRPSLSRTRPGKIVTPAPEAAAKPEARPEPKSEDKKPAGDYTLDPF